MLYSLWYNLPLCALDSRQILFMFWSFLSKNIWSAACQLLCILFPLHLSFSCPLFLVLSYLFLSVSDFSSSSPPLSSSFCAVFFKQGHIRSTKDIASRHHSVSPSVSLLIRHGGHPAAPSLACWIQSEQCGHVRAGRQHALPRHEAFVHIRLRLDLLLFYPVLAVAHARYLHLPQRCGLQPQSTAERGTPDQPGLHQHAQLQDGAGHAK